MVMARSSGPFELGRVVATPAAISAFEASGEQVADYLKRHANRDWGDVNEADKKLNDDDVDGGGRILSAYLLKSGTRIWIVTESDRFLTTALLPEEH